VDGTGTGSCPMVGFCINSAEPSGYITAVLYLTYTFHHRPNQKI
jgi:hypothetical protein